MTYTITAIVLDQCGEYPTEIKFSAKAEGLEAAKAAIRKLLTEGVHRNTQQTLNRDTTPATVFYPAHLIQRVTVEPPIPDFD